MAEARVNSDKQVRESSIVLVSVLRASAYFTLQLQNSNSSCSKGGFGGVAVLLLSCVSVPAMAYGDGEAGWLAKDHAVSLAEHLQR